MYKNLYGHKKGDDFLPIRCSIGLLADLNSSSRRFVQQVDANIAEGLWYRGCSEAGSEQVAWNAAGSAV